MNTRLIVVSGLSGSGKSVVLHTLEDLGFYCVDNLPMFLIPALADKLVHADEQTPRQIAIGVDARNRTGNLQQISDIKALLTEKDVHCEIIFLDAHNKTLIQRFNETRRKHPLSSDSRSLAEAIDLERELLEPVKMNADLVIDSTHTNVHQLRDLVRSRVQTQDEQTMSVLLSSFGFKHGLPNDADFIFDLRCLPNPHWEPELRPLTGQDEAVRQFLQRQEAVRRMIGSISGFIDEWLDCFVNEGRSYLTIAIGCTGGQHRSVYVTERIAEILRERTPGVIVRHRELI